MGMVQAYHVFVQFRPDGTNEHNLPYSIEPRKWHRLLVDLPGDPSHLDINRPVLAFGHSEWPTSMNLRVLLDEELLASELEYLKRAIPGAFWVNIFEPLDSTPHLQPIAMLATPKVRSFVERMAA